MYNNWYQIRTNESLLKLEEDKEITRSNIEDISIPSNEHIQTTLLEEQLCNKVDELNSQNNRLKKELEIATIKITDQEHLLTNIGKQCDKYKKLAEERKGKINSKIDIIKKLRAKRQKIMFIEAEKRIQQIRKQEFKSYESTYEFESEFSEFDEIQQRFWNEH